MAVRGEQKIYFKVLENHKRRLGDYEQVHFRKKSFDSRINVPAEIVLSPKRPMGRQQFVPFDRNNAALYLRQTESLWLTPSVSRQEAAKLLFDRPTGVFIVRNSQKARYALSVRLPTSDPAVSHFLIQTNQQGFLTIQGSKLPFLSIYDLLAYFCFNQSGGMPCLLQVMDAKASEAPAGDAEESSDSSDSDKEYEEVIIRPRSVGSKPPEPSDQLTAPTETPPPRPSPPPIYEPVSDPDVPPPRPMPPRSRSPSPLPVSIPPRSASNSVVIDSWQERKMSVDQRRAREEIFIDQQKQMDFVRNMKQQKQNSNRAHKDRVVENSHFARRKPPPKPPRNWEEEEEGGGAKEELTSGQREEINKVVRRVSSIVDVDVQQLFNHMASQPPPPIKPKPQRVKLSRVRKKLSRSAEHLSPGAKRTSCIVPTPVLDLVQIFESKTPPQEITPPSQRKKMMLNRTQSSEPELSKHLPPKPRAPPVPPKPYHSAVEQPPDVPPRTPARLLPPKPEGSCPPHLPPHNRQRSSSDTSMKARLEAILASGGNGPPGLPPKVRPRGGRAKVDKPPRELPPSFKEESPPPALSPTTEGEREGEGTEKEAEFTELSESVGGTSISQLPGSKQDEVGGDSTGAGGGKSSGLKWKPGWAKKLQFHKKPRKRIKKFILGLARDQSHEFGRSVNDFISDMRGRNTEAHQKMLSEIRNFITLSHDNLLQHHHSGLLNCGMEACNNFAHVMETSLQQCIVQPLSHYVYLRIEDYFTQHGYLFQVQRAIYQGKHRTPEEFGIRKHLVVPSEKAVAEIQLVFQRMINTYCAISKLEYLLEAVRLTYENVRDSKHPKKSMNDLGADDFLPLFVWVLVQCSFHRAEIEAEYMWGLAHPSLFNGEAGYYLTTLTSAVNVLKESTQPPQSPTPELQQLPCMTNLQTELKVFCEDENTGQFSSAYYLPILPTMTAAEICETIAERHRKPNPQDYALFTVVNGQATMMEDYERPQEIKLQWTLERSVGHSAQQPSSRFIAFKLRAPQAK